MLIESPLSCELMPGKDGMNYLETGMYSAAMCLGRTIGEDLDLCDPRLQGISLESYDDKGEDCAIVAEYCGKFGNIVKVSKNF